LISNAGFGKEFGHALGHGVGLRIHEAPRVSSKNEIVLQENMVITIEPGIYIPGFGGVRIEDMVAVRKNDCQVLTNTPRELIIL
jgi:Xaa-Pro aminopeptidase